MSNFLDGNEQPNGENIDELIDAISAKSEESEPSDRQVAKQDVAPAEQPAESPIEQLPTQQGLEDIQALVEKADSETPAPVKVSKKFVISIDNDFIDYFEDLTPIRRSSLVNELLKHEIENKDKKLKQKKLSQMLKHILIIVLTIVIGFPIIFYLVNTSLNSTLKSYKYMQVNFGKLYEQKNLNKLN